MSRLPDDFLGAIITVLPLNDGARTQILSRRWRPLWRSVPIDFEAKTFADTEAILTSHHGGPCRRLSLTWREYFSGFPTPPPPCSGCPTSTTASRSSSCATPPTLASSTGIRLEFPAAAAATAELGFPHLEQLTLKGVVVPESTLHGILSGCHALQSLVLHGNTGFRYNHLRISSRTLRSLGISGGDHGEVVIEDAPVLERIFQDGLMHCKRIRVIQAPKLKMLGYLAEFDPPDLTLEVAAATYTASVFTITLLIANLCSCAFYLGGFPCSFQKIELVSLPNPMRTVKILALDVAPDNLDVVIGFLTWFPCVEKLYMVR
ncbi:hypothetical protein HU200_028669 [Digitaria exilis]|uniref:F-box/LRR-repeat protein 15/At3g58940/PEG3-like LRR domain-containing protein n=1 Tax=Digitaria exilis TaxID=1010633 RepID=A0A835C3J7_9POAL|nr:hypothetical protein HU200_028669 [Digitaria exilis]